MGGYSLLKFVCACVSVYVDVCTHAFVEVGGQLEMPSSGMPPTSLRQGLSLPEDHQIGHGVPEILLSLSRQLSDHKHEPLSLIF